MPNDTLVSALAKAYCDALGAGDLDQIVSFYSHDVVVEDTWETRAYRGVDEVRRFLEPRLIALRPHWLVDMLIASDDGFALSWVVGGFNDGAFEGHPPTGKPFTCAGASIVQVRAGEIVRSRDFWNKHALLNQLGLQS